MDKWKNPKRWLPAFFIMLLCSVLLVWIPMIGSITAGFIGGRKAGNKKDAGYAASTAIGVTVIPLALMGYLLSTESGGTLLALIILGLIFLHTLLLELGAYWGGSTA